MKRKKTDVVQLSKIRLREDLRARLALAAEKREVTLNGEIVARLEQSFARESGEAREKTQIERNAAAFEWMVGSDESASDLLREMISYFQSNKDWGTRAGRERMAQHLSHYIVRPDILEMLKSRGEQ